MVTGRPKRFISPPFYSGVTPRRKEPMSLYLWIKNWLDEQEGQDLVEYALLLGLIAIICVAAVSLAGNKVSTLFSNVASTLPSGS
jgi:pilus assembly protein Flp/PilA